MKSNVIFVAKKVITMSHNNGIATHIAVEDGKILAVGGAELEEIYDFSIEDKFIDDVICPGFVEGHSHALEGMLWSYLYVGYHDRYDPDGKLWRGLKSIDEVAERIREVETTLPEKHSSIVAWGYDPIYFKHEQMDVKNLDNISMSRSIVIVHASAHCLNVNSKVLELADVSKDTNIKGVVKSETGELTGALKEMAAMFVAYEATGVDVFERLSESDLWSFGRIANRAGVTTAADLYNPLTEENLNSLESVTLCENYPIRIVPAYSAPTADTSLGILHLKKCCAINNSKLHIGSVKLMTDGSIQGFTARLQSGKYFNGASNGIWNAPPEELRQAVVEYHEAGIHLHIHANGDEASEVVLDALEAALEKKPCNDHRHTLQHCQMITEKQLKKAAANNICLNMFANHIYYWGDEHYNETVGPDRAEKMEPFNSAKKMGIKYAMHSDAPVTPMGPLFTAWCAVNRMTSSGRVLGADERIDVHDALQAITIDAAYTLKLDHLVGSIEIGKLADFTVLEQDPYKVDPARLKDINIIGTVLGGRVFEISDAV